MTTTMTPDPHATPSNELSFSHIAAGRGQRPIEPLIFEKSMPGKAAIDFPPLDVERTEIDPALISDPPDLPEVGQPEAVAHYSHLAERNLSCDSSFYPLGSCTMKHNPRINEWAAALPGMAQLHPLLDDSSIQGALRLLYETRCFLEEIAGLDEVCLQPAAGAHGEFTSLKVMRAYFLDHGQPQRTVVLTPDTAHGTNPASCAMCGSAVVKIRTIDGCTDLTHLRELIDHHGPQKIMALMITNPNTAGIFDSSIIEIVEIMHSAGAMVYLDGANMNAMLGRCRPGDIGIDCMHYNTHKTFSTPHGCGGPGAGPIAVSAALAPYLPDPQVQMADDGSFYLDRDREKSIGKVRSFICQFGVLVRCWAYISACGPRGLRNVSDLAVLNANYLAAELSDVYEMPFFDPAAGRFCAHEFVTVPQRLLDHGVTLVDIAKRMIDFSIHPPTMHWPLHDCLMVEPTESESKGTLDRFVAVMKVIAAEIQEDAAAFAQHPSHSVIRRADEVAAARNPDLTHRGHA